MATTKSDTFKRLATRLIAEFGVAATLQRTTRVHDEALDQVVETTSAQPIMVVIEVQDHDDKDGRFVKGTYIKSDTSFIVADLIKVGTSTYIVDEVFELAPQATGILYRAKVR